MRGEDPAQLRVTDLPAQVLEAEPLDLGHHPWPALGELDELERVIEQLAPRALGERRAAKQRLLDSGDLVIELRQHPRGGALK